jgi:O-antigen ligase/tetratricopeptide (TPR) repeat protein
MENEEALVVNQKISSFTENLIKYGLPILYFLISIAFYLKTYDSAQIKITLIQLGGTIILATWLIKLIEEDVLMFLKKNIIVILPLLLFLFSGIFSHLHSPFKYASGNELVRRVLYIAMALIVLSEFKTEDRMKRLFNWLFAACFVATIYGVVQYLDGRFFPPAPEPGLDPFIWRGAFGARVFSTFGNPNFYGDFLVVLSPLTLAMFLYTRKLHLLLLWALIAFNVIITYSKGAWLGFAAGMLIFVFFGILFFWNAQKEKVRKIATIIALITILVVSMGIYKNLRGRTDSASFRIFTWLSTWEMINTHPVIGTGVGTFYVTYPAWRRPQIFYIEAKHNTETDHPEDEYLEVWYDEGLIGFGVFLWLISMFILVSVRNLSVFSKRDIELQKSGKRDIRAYIQYGTLTALMAQLVHNFVCVSLRFVSSGIFLWLLIGIIGALTIHNPMPAKSESDEKSGFDTLVALLAVVGCYLLVQFIWLLPKDLFNIVMKVGIGLSLVALAAAFVNRYAVRFVKDRSLLFKRAFQFLVIFFAIHFLRVFYGYFDADENHNLAIFYSKQAQWDTALDHYNTVVTENPSFIMAQYFMGNVYNDRWAPGDAEKSIEKYDDVWKLAPNYVQSHHQAGLIYLKWGQDEQAKEQAAASAGDKKAIKEHEAKKVELWRKALSEFERYKAIDPVFNINYYRIAWIYMQLGEKEKAEQTYLDHLNFPAMLQKPPHNAWVEDWGVRRNSELSETCVYLGNYYMADNLVDKAGEYYKKAADLDPNSPMALKNLAAYFGRKGDMQHAGDLWQRIRQIAPNDPDVKRVFNLK